MTRTRIFAAATALLVASACGSPESKPDAGNEPVDAAVDSGTPDAGTPDAGHEVDAGPVDGGFGPIAIEDWCQMQAMAKCYQRSRCLSLAPEQTGECLARQQQTCDQQGLTRGVDEGRLQYLPQQAADCINAYGSGSCTATPPECEAVFQGLVEPDGGCLTQGECVLGAYCLVWENTCPFTCYAYRKAGESCDWWHNQCDPNEGTCETVDGGNICVPRGNLGDACQYWSDCQAGLACIDEQCIQYTVPVGETCGEFGNFYYPSCEGDAFCRQPHDKDGKPTDAGVCMQRAALGGVCTGYGSCKTGLRCASNFTTATCIPLGHEGDTCSNYNDCEDELYCDSASSRCTRFPADGGDCSYKTSSYRCATGYYCDYNTDSCLPLEEVGQPCNYDGVCSSSSCDYGTLPDGGSGYVCSEKCSSVADGGF